MKADEAIPKIDMMLVAIQNKIDYLQFKSHDQLTFLVGIKMNYTLMGNLIIYIAGIIFSVFQQI